MKILQLSAAEAASGWLNGRFLMRSGYYAGRGPESDLNSGILEMFYSGLKKDVGIKTAQNFVRFVNKLRDLSATSFIVAFEKFWASGCTSICVTQHNADRNQLSGRGQALQGEAFGLLMEVLSGKGAMDEESIVSASNRIKRSFIQNHRSEIPADEVEKEAERSWY